MTITVSKELEERLRDRASREGTELETVVEALLLAALDREEAIAGIQRGLEASRQGRVRAAEAVFTDLRVHPARPQE